LFKKEKEAQVAVAFRIRENCRELALANIRKSEAL